MPALPLPPRHTGRADFPPPAFPDTFASGAREELTGNRWLLLGRLAQLRSQKREFRRPSPRLRRGAIGLVQAVLPSSDIRTDLAGPLRSADITPLRRYYAPRRLPTRASPAVMHSRRELGWRPPGRVSQVPDGSFAARRPQSPRRARPVPTPVASRSVAGLTTCERLATLEECFEAEAGSLDCGSRLRLPRLRTPDYADARLVGYLLNGQFTR